MRRRTVTMMQELPSFLRGCTVEELYQLARALRHDLARRGLLSTIEADELVEAMLLDARVEHRAIFSADCSASWPPFTVNSGDGAAFTIHGRAPAEKS